MDIHFEYEIEANVYAAAQSLYHRLNGGRKRVQNAICWILWGSFFVVLAWNEMPFGWTALLLAGVGARWISGILHLFLPARYFRRFHAASQLAGKKFSAEVNENGLDVVGDTCSWRVKWEGIQLRGENKLVFMLYSQGTIFMFGKRYLTIEQQSDLRRICGLSDSTA